MDKIAIIIIIVVIVLGAGFFIWQYPVTGGINNVPPATLPAGIVLFYGDTCSHCKDVEDFIAANEISQKVQYTSMEVFKSVANAKLLVNTGTSCALASGDIGAVPLLYDGTKCYLGAPDVIDFFKTQAGIQ